MDDENDRHVTKNSKRHSFSLKEKTCFDIFIAPFSLVLYHLLPILSFYHCFVVISIYYLPFNRRMKK